MHARVAEFLETAPTGDLAAHYGRLAHHWSAATVDAPTFKYLELAAAEVLRKGAFREAIGHLGKALELDDVRGQPSARADRARWHRLLGDAHDGIGEMREAQRHMVAA